MRLLARGVALLIMVIPGVSFSLGLGDIEVNTALNQPLYAEIKLHSIHRDELEDMRVTVAPDAAFKRAGIDRPFVLNRLRFAPKINKAGQAVIEITSKTAVREPFLNFLLEVQWPNGRLLREYTILLDPPVMFEQADTVGIQPPVTDQRTGTAASFINDPSSAAANESEYRRSPVNRTEQTRISPASQPRPQTYQTKAGDTLSEIAADLRPEDNISLAQMMIALQRANPESFIRGNINELMAGVIMRVPTREELAAVDRVQASAEVLRHNTLWRQYRAKLTANVPTKPSGDFEGRIQSLGQEGEIEGSPGGEVTTAETSDDKLEILAADNSETEKAGNPAYDAELSELRKDAAFAREMAESRSAENEELRSKVQQLEEMLASQERLINLQSEELSTLQNRLAAAEQGAVDVEAVSNEPSAAVEAFDAGDSTENAGHQVVGTDLSSRADQDTLAAGERDVKAEDMDVAASLVGSKDQELSAPEQLNSEQSQTTEHNDTEVAPVGADISDSPTSSETQSEPTAYESPAESEAQSEPYESPARTEDATIRITENPMILAAIAGGGLLLAVLSWLLIKRFRKSKEAVHQGGLSDVQQEQSLEQQDVAAASMAHQEDDDTNAQGIGEEVDSSSVSKSVTSDGDKGSLSEEPSKTIAESEAGSEADRSKGDADQDDTLTEADVYIAYNLHQQAEDLLKDALTGDPERDDYRIKLLENYCAANDRESFVSVAEELRVRCGGAGERWEHVLSLANKISLDHSLLTGTQQGNEGVASAQLSEADVGVGADNDQHPGTDMVGDMGSGYLSELENEPEPELSDYPSAPLDDEAQDALEFDVSDLDLSFQSDSTEDSANEAAEERLTDSASLDFDLAELGIDHDVDAQDTEHSETGQWPEALDLESSDGEDAITSLADDQPLDGTEVVPKDAESDTPIDESDIYTSDIEFEQSTAAFDQDEGSLIDEQVAKLPEDDGLPRPLDEAQTEILKPLGSESSADNDFHFSKEESRPSDFAASDDVSELGMHDGLERDLSFDEVQLDWPSEEAAQAQPVDEISRGSEDVALDLSSTSSSSQSPPDPIEADSDVTVESGQDESGSISQDAVIIPEQVEESSESEDLADVESILADMSDDRQASDHVPPFDLDGMEENFPKGEDSAPGTLDDQVLEGIADNTEEAFEAYDPSDEVNTKIDLARAYIDMGDSEGARGALEEVMHQGDEKQRREAEGLLKQIA